MGEQLRRLDAAGIPYTVTPGVPSFAAAAAALGQELTLPEVAQSVVLTRTSGRASAMPRRRDARGLRGDRRDARHPPVDPRARQGRGRADAVLRRRLSRSPSSIARAGRTSASSAARSPPSRPRSAKQPIERTALDPGRQGLGGARLPRSRRCTTPATSAASGAANERGAELRALPADARLPAGRGLAGRRRPRRSATADLARAARGLATADDIVHDALIDPRVLGLKRDDAQLISAGKRGGQPSRASAGDQRPADRARTRGPARAAAEGRRSVRVRPRLGRGCSRSPKPASATASSPASPRAWRRRRWPAFPPRRATPTTPSSWRPAIAPTTTIRAPTGRRWRGSASRSSSTCR